MLKKLVVTASDSRNMVYTQFPALPSFLYPMGSLNCECCWATAKYLNFRNPTHQLVETWAWVTASAGCNPSSGYYYGNTDSTSKYLIMLIAIFQLLYNNRKSTQKVSVQFYKFIVFSISLSVLTITALDLTESEVFVVR